MTIKYQWLFLNTNIMYLILYYKLFIWLFGNCWSKINIYFWNTYMPYILEQREHLIQLVRPKKTEQMTNEYMPFLLLMLIYYKR
jgi:hypothetical protein